MINFFSASAKIMIRSLFCYLNNSADTRNNTTYIHRVIYLERVKESRYIHPIYRPGCLCRSRTTQFCRLFHTSIYIFHRLRIPSLDAVRKSLSSSFTLPFQVFSIKGDRIAWMLPENPNFLFLYTNIHELWASQERSKEQMRNSFVRGSQWFYER